MFKTFVKALAFVSTLLAVSLNIYIFTYPSLNPKQCSWKCQKTDFIPELQGLSTWDRAILYATRYFRDIYDTIGGQRLFDESYNDSDVRDVRLLALGDPQIKGNWPSTPYIKRLDTYGNDYYLGHIFRMMNRRLKPTHVAVMGDIFSSQWISDSEFFNRTMRFTHRVLGRDTEELEEIQKKNNDSGLYQVDWHEHGRLFKNRSNEKPMAFNWHYQDAWAWTDEDEYLLINITGNHDVGYSGDATYQHMARFTQLFGQDSYWIEYDRDTDHPWRIVVLNDLLLEGPALQPEFVNATWEFLYQLFERKFEGSTVLLTHVPLYKEEGICVDGPEFKYYPDGYEREPYKAGLLKSQNHLSEDVTKRVLNLVFHNNKPGVILTGHDHEGCETIYKKNMSSGIWTTSKTVTSDIFLQEITVRSMMGEYGGNTGLLTGHFNSKSKNWTWSYSLCPFSVQHLWWATKVSTILAGSLLSLLLVL
ncbi:Ted1p Ecym_4371 [Eremothecium cymbalariae DBVPG|uniref:Calcineurin-like phosphoesterase domain-containing protein n=1 Tax=Eremothecium cymbalariae (strain CBS 270.75 / DBVPG 7215 / KCTC 17166 / NRRL Y-17582) TaxID=931890 RepID=G8JTS4_ERECY|nr:hypothetical protein Ecym_4371 [Eremothecium cymbalariae DBVPG\